MNRPELTGQRFGRLTVTALAFQYSENGRYWHCRCTCGKRVVQKECDLLGGRVHSCGCLRGKKKAKRKKWTKAYAIHGNTTHGDRRVDGEECRLYRIWSNMKARCNRKTHPAYKRYGGRGIKVCELWQESYIIFREWAYKSGYTEEMTIDRIDNDGDYEPENCQWLSKAEHSRKSNKTRKDYRKK